jgi:hypothetical protein
LPYRSRQNTVHVAVANSVTEGGHDKEEEEAKMEAGEIAMVAKVAVPPPSSGEPL